MSKKTINPKTNKVINEEIQKEEIAINPNFAEEKTDLKNKPGEIGYFNGRCYRVLTGNAKGVAIWGDTGECFSINDFIKEKQK